MIDRSLPSTVSGFITSLLLIPCMLTSVQWLQKKQHGDDHNLDGKGEIVEVKNSKR